MDTDELAEIIYQHVWRQKEVAFHDLEWFFKMHGFDYKGNRALGIAENTLVWTGWNNEAIQVTNQAIEMGLAFRPVSIYEYTLDGYALPLPLAKHANGYKREFRWLPVVLVPNET